jgi:ABC-2 type transport system permease protein
MNPRAIGAIYAFEMARTARTLLQSIVAPVITTALYFVVFGAAIGTRISQIEGVEYGAFIVPGLVMLTLLTQSVSNASFGIYFPRFSGTIYEILSAPVSAFEVVIGLLRAPSHRASRMDARFSVPHGRDLQPARLHHRHMGRRL